MGNVNDKLSSDHSSPLPKNKEKYLTKIASLKFFLSSEPHSSYSLKFSGGGGGVMMDGWIQNCFEGFPYSKKTLKFEEGQKILRSKLRTHLDNFLKNQISKVGERKKKPD